MANRRVRNVRLSFGDIKLRAVIVSRDSGVSWPLCEEVTRHLVRRKERRMKQSHARKTAERPTGSSQETPDT